MPAGKLPPDKARKTRCHVCGRRVAAIKSYGWPWVLAVHKFKGSECRGSMQAAQDQASVNK